MGDVQIHQIANMKKLKNPLVVVGFPGTGLVGSVAASHMVDALSMEFGGYMTSAEFAPLAAIHDYKPMPAARIHFSAKHNMIVILSEMTIPVGSSLEVADKIYDFAKKMNASSIISLGAISLQEGARGIYIISSDKGMVKKATAKKLAKPIREGATTGVTGILLTKGALDSFPTTTLLAESSEEYLDPKAAAFVLKTFTKLIGIKVNTRALDREALELAEGVKESVIKARVSKKGASADEGGSMYG